MISAYPIRPVTPAEFPAFRAVLEQAFHSEPSSEAVNAGRLARIEWPRTLAVFDGDTMTGTAGAFSFRMCIPGALAPVAGVTLVSVLPSHRRRGILSALIRRQLGDLHESGEAVAALFASEAGIYRRFGYGPASRQVSYTLRAGEGRLVPPVPPPGQDAGGGEAEMHLRVAEPQDARAVLAEVFASVLPGRPGLFARDDVWWDRVLADPAESRHGACPLRCVLAEDGDGPRGYALFAVRGGYDDASLPAGEMEIREVVTATPAATSAIWADLLSRDLVGTFRAAMRPADDPLLHLLADRRRVRASVTDGLWVRVVDVGRALPLRRYALPVDVVIGVKDEYCPWNQGRWRLSAGSTGPSAAGYGAICAQTTAPADIEVPAHALGSAYLGGERLGPLAEAGLVTQVRPGALAALSAAFSWDPLPWCPTIF